MRILFTCHPGFGHLHPMLPLARSARRAGHDVLVATGPDLVPRVERLGFAAAAAGLSRQEINDRYNARHQDSDALAPEERLRKVVPRLFVDIGARTRLPSLERLVRTHAFGLIVYEQSELAAPIVAARRGIASVAHGYGPMIPLEAFGDAGAALDALAAEHGVRDMVATATAGPYVDICPPGLHVLGPSMWRHVLPVRHEDPPPAPGERLPEQVDRLAQGDALYVTLGTVVNTAPGVFEAVLAGVRDAGSPVVVTVGPDVDPASLGPQPLHVAVERFIPQGLLLPRCRAVIAHAGAGTMLGALAHGLPQVLLPHGAEQFLNAAACRAAGAAVTLDPSQVDAAAVAEALGRILAEPAYGAAARGLAREIAAMPPADATLEALLDVVPA